MADMPILDAQEAAESTTRSKAYPSTCESALRPRRSLSRDLRDEPGNPHAFEVCDNENAEGFQGRGFSKSKRTHNLTELWLAAGALSVSCPAPMNKAGVEGAGLVRSAAYGVPHRNRLETGLSR